MGLRAYVAFACPLFAKIAAGMVSSAVLLMLSFTQGPAQHCRLPAMGVRYAKLVIAEAWAQKSLLLFASLAVGGASFAGFAKAAYMMITATVPIHP